MSPVLEACMDAPDGLRRLRQHSETLELRSLPLAHDLAPDRGQVDLQLGNVPEKRVSVDAKVAGCMTNIASRSDQCEGEPLLAELSQAFFQRKAGAAHQRYCFGEMIF